MYDYSATQGFEPTNSKSRDCCIINRASHWLTLLTYVCVWSVSEFKVMNQLLLAILIVRSWFDWSYVKLALESACMGARLITLGTAGMGSDCDAAARKVNSVKSRLFNSQMEIMLCHFKQRGFKRYNQCHWGQKMF